MIQTNISTVKSQLSRLLEQVKVGEEVTILDRACEVLPSSEIRDHSRRLLMTHPLRAGNALQLAAAVLFADSEVQKLPFLTMNKNLADCAEKEGFPVPSWEP